MQRASWTQHHHHHQQKHKQLHRRQRGVLLPIDDENDTISSGVVSLPSPATGGGRGGGGGGRGRGGNDEEEEDESQESQPLSLCSTTCLSTHLGNNCRTISCMCNNPELLNANTCIAAVCPDRDRGIFLANVQAWCGNAQAVALLTPGAGISSSSTAASRGASSSSTQLSPSSVISTASPASSSDSASLASESITESEVPSSSSSVVSSPSTTRRIATRTATLPTTLEEADSTSIETGRVNPKIDNSDLASSSSNDDGSNGSEKKGASSGTIAGIVCGMLLAFILIGLCAWFVRKSLLGRNKRGKEFLRSSDPGDWVNKDDFNKNTTKSGGDNDDHGGIFDEKDAFESEKAIQERNNNNIDSMHFSNHQNIHPGIGAYAIRALPPHPQSITGQQAEQNYRQSQRQYEDVHASLAYPSHMGISPSSPYNTHPQFYPQPYSSSNSQSQSQFITPHTSIHSVNTITPPLHSAGLHSTMANLSHHDSVSGSPYPESITMTPETIHITNGVGNNTSSTTTTGTSNDINASPFVGRHQSIPFIIPASLQGGTINKNNLTTMVDSPRIANGASLQEKNRQIGHSQNQLSYSGSMNGTCSLPRSLTVGGQSMIRPSSSSSGNATVTGQNGSKIQVIAQETPLPISPPVRNASLPMSLPGMVADPTGIRTLQPSMGNASTRVEEKGEATDRPTNQQVEEKSQGIMSENPFLDSEDNEKVNEIEVIDGNEKSKRESFEGLAYLS